MVNLQDTKCHAWDGSDEDITEHSYNTYGFCYWCGYKEPTTPETLHEHMPAESPPEIESLNLWPK